MPREIRPPRVVERLLRQIPNRLPLEETLDRALDSLEERVAEHPITKKLEELHSRLPVSPPIDLVTPLGTVKLPELSFPKPVPPKIDTRKREAVKAAIGQDLSYVPGLLPVVGDVLADAISDIFGAKIYETLTKEEFREFQKYDKISPLSTVAMLRVFTKIRM